MPSPPRRAPSPPESARSSHRSTRSGISFSIDSAVWMVRMLPKSTLANALDPSAPANPPFPPAGAS